MENAIEPLILASDGYRLELAPALGGALLSFSKNGRDLLRPGTAAAVAKDRRAAACYPCVPYFGRLFGGVLVNGETVTQSPTLAAADPDYALHGEGWISAWECVAESANAATLLFRHDGKQPGRFPFAYEARQDFHLDADGLTLSLSVENLSAATMPAGLGLHPFFPRFDDTRIAFTADAMWAPRAEGGGDIRTNPFAPNSARKIPDGIDHSFTGFAGAVEIRQPGATLLLTTDAPALHLYAPAGEDYFCLEPITQLPGAFQDPAAPAPGERLAPGARSTLTLSLS